jgi:hypothetical protein
MGPVGLCRGGLLSGILFFKLKNTFLFWGYIVAFTKLLTIYQIYHSWSHPIHCSPLFHPAPIPGIVSVNVIFTCTYMCTQYQHYIHPPTPTPHILPTLTSTYPPRQDLFCLPVLRFCKRKKKWHFCLSKISVQGVSLWHFYVRMYYNLNWFISSIFLLSTLAPFLWWFQQV